MSEAKGPYCKRVGSSEIQFRGKLEKCVYELTSPYVIDKQVEMINRAYEDGVKEGRASSDGLREALEKIAGVDYRGNRPVSASIAMKALKDDGEVK